jgi:hypothetical protein
MYRACFGARDPLTYLRLGWFSFDGFLSLGFGRPQSTQFETVDEQGFLQVRLNQPIPRPGTTQSLSLYGDIYIAGQVQLTQIGRDLVNWGEMLADPERAVQADPRRAEMLKDREMRVLSMFRELNGRLDDWCKLWVWSGGYSTLSWDVSSTITPPRKGVHTYKQDHRIRCISDPQLGSPDFKQSTCACA